tara:strand:- start:601 stop:801 length:201 start_codon:yes stop_codon:yes gene_type:complete
MKRGNTKTVYLSETAIELIRLIRTRTNIRFNVSQIASRAIELEGRAVLLDFLKKQDDPTWVEWSNK